MSFINDTPHPLSYLYSGSDVLYKAIVKAKKKAKKHWYFFYHEECPVCGRLSDWKERRYGKKPKRREKRHQYSQTYDHCDY